MAEYPDHTHIAQKLLDQQGEITDLTAQLGEAATALHAVGKAAIVVQPALDQPYTDAPQWTPWTRWMRDPARRAYNLAALLRRQLGLSRSPGISLTSNAATRLYDAARTQASQNPGHPDGCEWHSNNGTYCSCHVWPAACAGVDTTIEALDTDSDEGQTP